MIHNKTQPTVFGGTMIIAGTTIGAGMLALPTISAGMWLFWSCILLFTTWFSLYFSSKALLEVNLHYEPGVSFNTLVKDTLGPIWNIINGISILFVLYILLYAYISGGSSVIKDFMSRFLNTDITYTISSLLFSFIFIIIVFSGAHAVDRFSSILVIGLVLAFIVAMSGMVFSIDINNLLDSSNNNSDNKIMFIWVAVSTYFTSFAFHNAIPSLVKYFGKDPVRISKSILYGTVIALVCYIIWIVIAQGNISRNAYKIVIAEGGNVDALLRVMNQSGNNVYSWISPALNLFAFFALTTSFLGVGLGLFDYLADLGKFDNSLKGRSITLLLTFLPPVIGGVFFPNGFIQAIAWAGLFCVIWAMLIPALMLIKVRKKYNDSIYTAYKGNGWSYFLITYGILCGICHILVVFKILPEFQ